MEGFPMGLRQAPREAKAQEVVLLPWKGIAVTKLKHSTRASALIATIVVALLLTMVGSGLAAPDDTTLVSAASSGEQGNLDSYQPSISADGRYVAFVSSADNLVESDTNGVVDVFVRDLQARTTERISVDDNGNQQNDQQQRDGSTFCGLDISADGRYVAFSSAADNLVPNNTNAACDIYRARPASGYDRAGGHSRFRRTGERGQLGPFHKR
jgi:hypothetical protein